MRLESAKFSETLEPWHANQENHESTKFRKHERKPQMGHEFEALSGQILEVAVDVHRILGPGFLESVYENALVVALNHRGIRFERQYEVRVWFEEQEVGVHRLDLLVDGQIVVEIKAVKALDDVHFAQLRSYLKATGLHVGLLLNFNAPILVAKRVVL
jgi:GxxExxY protein